MLAMGLAALLNSCHFSLYMSAAQGDLEGVKQALTAGPSLKNINSAADLAYEGGHTAVLNELVKAGAVVAPDSVSNKQLITQNEASWTNPDSDFGDWGYSTYAEFLQYWNTHSLRVLWQKDGNVDNSHSWKNSNTHTREKESDELKYARVGAKSAFVTYHAEDYSNMSARENWECYLLNFTSPTSGSFTKIEGGNHISAPETWSRGTFSLKNK